MKHTEKIAPIAAALSALATLTCCLPIAFVAGTASASLAMVAGSYRWSFLGASVVLLAVGAVQLVRARRACRPRGAASLGIRYVRHHRAGRGALPTDDCRAARRLDAMSRRKLLLLVLPLALLGAVAYVGFATHDAPAGQPPLAYLDLSSLAALKADFNRAADETRLIVLLAPT